MFKCTGMRLEEKPRAELGGPGRICVLNYFVNHNKDFGFYSKISSHQDFKQRTDGIRLFSGMLTQAALYRINCKQPRLNVQRYLECSRYSRFIR